MDILFFGKSQQKSIQFFLVELHACQLKQTAKYISFQLSFTVIQN
ncbi:hypothetical protein AQPE_2964 [Aquipluma nitroreducens]|uniref:Uncharacterized protein n=1 Tax=Aquipluma nitroreducens TaxID=2010828 RepID=A0A5K7SBG2_9BACT|nr:hypothetical protein AQPE_2964 [Aquipluma nitroreducens]